MRRAAFLVCLLSLILAAPARADEQIEAGPTCCRFTFDVYTMDMGEPLTFVNNDLTGARHDVESLARAPDGRAPLFRAAEIGTGANTFVEGSQYLTTGTYRFRCTLHNGMEADLVVTGQGTPTPRPPGGGQTTPSDTTPPKVRLKVARTLRAKSLARRRAIPAVVEVDERAPVRLTAYIGTKKIGSLKAEVTPQVETDVEIRVSRRNARLLRKGKKLRLVAAATDAAGNKGEASVTKTLR